MSGPEHKFQKFVVSVLEDLCGFDVYVMSQPKPWLGTPGIPDLFAVHTDKELRLFLELKAPEKSRGLTDHQELFFERVNGAGGRCYLVDSVEKLEQVLTTYGWELELS